MNFPEVLLILIATMLFVVFIQQLLLQDTIKKRSDETTNELDDKVDMVEELIEQGFKTLEGKFKHIKGFAQTFEARVTKQGKKVAKETMERLIGDQVGEWVANSLGGLLPGFLGQPPPPPPKKKV